MTAKRIIPCLDVMDGQVVKGVRFDGLREVGDPVLLARSYYEQGADEIVFLDIGASPQERRTLLEVVRKTSQQIFVPLTVGGGIRSVDDVRMTLGAGADRVSINSAAVRRPELLDETAEAFGSQCVVLAIDARQREQGWEVVVNGGRQSTGMDAIEWAKEGEYRGAGELLVTSMDSDGTKAGYDLELLRAVAGSTHISVIASGGAGSVEDFVLAATEGEADGILAASLFHFGELTIQDVKHGMQARGVAVRCE